MNPVINSELNKAKRELNDILNDENSTEKEKDYAVKHAKWIAEKQVKNKMIKTKDKQENVQRKRSDVYWCSLGMNVGSELCEDHFCVVVKEYSYTAVIIPLSSQKNEIQKTEEDGFFNIGIIDGLPISETKAYALLSQIKTVSKKRLSNYRTRNGDYLNLKLNDDQMDIIDQAIKDYLTNN